MKKLISVLLTAALVLSGMSVFAAGESDGECQHENREEIYPYYDFIRETAVDNGDGTHTIDGYRVVVYDCPDCGEFFEVRSEEPESVTDPHYYEQGYCDWCGAKNPCEHTEKSQYPLEEGREIDESSVENNEDGTHKVRFRNYVKYHCNNCEGDFTVYDESWTEAESEAHDWNRPESSCRVCGAENSCDHPNMTEDEVLKKTRYFIDRMENRHDVYVTVFAHYVCADCGLDELEANDEYDIYEDHEYAANGYCICGACGHPNKEEIGGYDETDDESYCDNGDGTHSFYKYHVIIYSCPDCGDNVYVTGDEPQPVTEAHSFWRGECSGCGAENTCEHPDEDRMVERSYREVDEDTLTDNEDGTHTVKYQNVTEYRCRLCGDFFAVADEEWTGPVTERHDWSYEGWCKICPAENSCEHENLETSEVLVPEEYYDYDAEEHVVYGGVYIRYVCDDCGMDDLEYDREYEDYEDHDFSNGDCICGACSHQNSELEDTVTSWGNDLKDNNDGTHIGTLYTYGEYICQVCGEGFTRLISTEENAAKKHEFSSNGTCFYCGSENPCEHTGEKDYQIFAYADYSEEPTITAAAHSFPAFIARNTRCKDCGQDLGWENTPDSPLTRPHEFYDGVCNACGYLNTCAHTNQREVYYFEDDFTQQAKPIEGTNQHTLNGKVVTKMECLACGETFEKSAYLVETTANHEYENERCYYCGYQNPCRHENIVEKAWTNWGSAVDNGSDGHKAPTWSGTERYCTDCGAYISGTTDPTIEETLMPHSYANGVCYDCGHVNTCSHTNTETNTALEFTTVSYDDTRHTIYAQVQKQIVCECGEILSSTADGEPKEITEAHSLYIYGEHIACEYCWFYLPFVRDLDSMSTLTLPAEVKTVSSEAFAGTAAEVIIIPENCESVASDAFSNCPNLIYIINHSDLIITAPQGVLVIGD